jgi:hypothetical protein
MRKKNIISGIKKPSNDGVCVYIITVKNQDKDMTINQFSIQDSKKTKTKNTLFQLESLS